MIYAVGDSHCQATFKGIPGVTSVWLGPITMKRVGYPEDDSIRGFSPSPGDRVIFCFGEIDCRCHIKNLLAVKTRTLEGVLAKIVDPYVQKVESIAQALPGVHAAVMSVVPAVSLGRMTPQRRELFVHNEFPVVGEDDERSLYALEMNTRLRSLLEGKSVTYLDIYSRYVDSTGVFTDGLSDGGVHVGNTGPVREFLASIGWISPPEQA